jgi:hypothetical protein
MQKDSETAVRPKRQGRKTGPKIDLSDQELWDIRYPKNGKPRSTLEVATIAGYHRRWVFQRFARMKRDGFRPAA